VLLLRHCFLQSVTNHNQLQSARQLSGAERDFVVFYKRWGNATALPRERRMNGFGFGLVDCSFGCDRFDRGICGGNL
jgi:hypothetical protein